MDVPASLTPDFKLAADLMLRNPKTLGPAASVAEVREQLANPKVQMVLLADGRAFTVIKVYRSADEMTELLGDAGFVGVEVTTSGRFFLLATAVKP